MLRACDVVDFQCAEYGGFQEPDPGGEVDRASLVVPARAPYVATVRLTAAALAARCGLTVDEIEDLRLAVDEACNLLLADPAAGPANAAALSVHFELAAGLINVEVSVPGERAIERHRPSWAVLSALTDSVAVLEDGTRSGIALFKRRDIARS
jgi:serine/threonine-protein kinase RsbW